VYAQNYWKFQSHPPGVTGPTSPEDNLSAAEILASLALRYSKNPKQLPIILKMFGDGSLAKLPLTIRSFSDAQAAQVRHFLKSKSDEQLARLSIDLVQLAKLHKDLPFLASEIIAQGYFGDERKTSFISANKKLALQPSHSSSKIKELLGCGAHAVALITHQESGHVDKKQIVSSLASLAATKATMCDNLELHEVYHALVQIWLTLGNTGVPGKLTSGFSQLQRLFEVVVDYEKGMTSSTSTGTTASTTAQRVYVHALSVLLEFVITELNAANARFMAVKIADLPAATEEFLLLKAGSSHTAQLAVEAAGTFWRAATGALGF